MKKPIFERMSIRLAYMFKNNKISFLDFSRFLKLYFQVDNTVFRISKNINNIDWELESRQDTLWYSVNQPEPTEFLIAGSLLKVFKFLDDYEKVSKL